VYHDGREELWTAPKTPEVEAYLAATARDFFCGQMPQERKPTFNAKTAAERVREKLQEKGDKPAGTQTRGAEGSQNRRRGSRATGA
jgi:hypothetical protein